MPLGTTSASTIVTPCPSACTSTGLSSISEISFACRAASTDSLRNQLRQRGNIRFRRATKSFEQRRGLETLQHRGRFRSAHRRRPVDHVAKQFRGDAAETDHDHRPESPVRQRADDDLDAFFRHRADQHALDRRIGPVFSRAIQQRAVSREGLALGRDVDAGRRRLRSCAGCRATGSSSPAETARGQSRHRVRPAPSPALRPAGDAGLPQQRLAVELRQRGGLQMRGEIARRQCGNIR